MYARDAFSEIRLLQSNKACCTVPRRKVVPSFGGLRACTGSLVLCGGLHYWYWVGTKIWWPTATRYSTSWLLRLKKVLSYLPYKIKILSHLTYRFCLESGYSVLFVEGQKHSSREGMVQLYVLTGDMKWKKFSSISSTNVVSKIWFGTVTSTKKDDWWWGDSTVKSWGGWYMYECCYYYIVSLCILVFVFL